MVRFVQQVFDDLSSLVAQQQSMSGVAVHQEVGTENWKSFRPTLQREISLPSLRAKLHMFLDLEASV